jgi:hypothetical protein
LTTFPVRRAACAPVHDGSLDGGVAPDEIPPDGPRLWDSMTSSATSATVKCLNVIEDVHGSNLRITAIRLSSVHITTRA